MASTPLFGERDLGVQLLQLSPEVTDGLQDALHAAFKVPLHLEEPPK